MKTLLCLLFNAYFLTNVFAQSEEQIHTIDVLRQEIDKNLENYEMDEKTNDSTGNKYIYTLDKELKLITVEINEQGINKNVKWYFDKNQLIFSEQIWKNIKTGKLLDDEKFYVNNNSLIAYFIFEKKIEPISAEFKQVADKLLTGLDNFKEDLKNKY